MRVKPLFRRHEAGKGMALPENWIEAEARAAQLLAKGFEIELIAGREVVRPPVPVPVLRTKFEGGALCLVEIGGNAEGL